MTLSRVKRLLKVDTDRKRANTDGAQMENRWKYRYKTYGNTHGAQKKENGKMKKKWTRFNDRDSTVFGGRPGRWLSEAPRVMEKQSAK